MNWIGGARARAKLKDQRNVNGNRKSRPNLAALLSDDDEEDDVGGIVAGDENDEGRVFEETSFVAGGRRKRNSKRKSNIDESVEERSIDYAALGYRLVRPEKVQRRVVPLIEFVETKFPKNGHVLSLQLSHLMDITRIPINNESTSFQRRSPTSTSVNTDTTPSAVTSFQRRSPTSTSVNTDTTPSAVTSFQRRSPTSTSVNTDATPSTVTSSPPSSCLYPQTSKSTESDNSLLNT